MNSDKIINAQGSQNIHSWNGISELRPQPPKDPEKNLNTSSTQNPPISSGSNESENSNNTSNNG